MNDGQQSSQSHPSNPTKTNDTTAFEAPSSPTPPDDELDENIDDLIDIESSMMREQEELDDVDGELNVEEEGGGFFHESDSPVAPSSNTESGILLPSNGSSSATPSVADPDSIDEDAPSRPFPSGCRECGNIGVDKNYLTAFGVNVCYRCQQIHKNRYALITQTTCTNTYMLPLQLVQSKLGFIEKKRKDMGGKQSTNWGFMKLYWKQQVLALVRERYGTRDNLEAAKRDRDLTRIRRDDSKRRNAHAVAARTAAFSSTLAASMAEVGEQSALEIVTLLQERTKGMAPTVTKKDRKKKRKNEDEAEDAVDEEDDEVVAIDRPSSTNGRKKSKSSAPTSSAAVKRKSLHTHTFADLDDGRQRCTDPACGFTMEFESF